MAFRAADVVLVATSPPSTPSSYPNVYRNVDKHLLRLLKENYPQRNKRYYALHLPYCDADDIPEEARLFRMFRVPRDLRKLVKTIHGIGCLRFRSPRDNTGIPEILYSIQLAADMLMKEQNATVAKKRTTEETGKRPCDDVLDAEIDGFRAVALFRVARRRPAAANRRTRDRESPRARASCGHPYEWAWSCRRRQCYIPVLCDRYQRTEPARWKRWQGDREERLPGEERLWVPYRQVELVISSLYV